MRNNLIGKKLKRRRRFISKQNVKREVKRLNTCMDRIYIHELPTLELKSRT